MNSCHAVRVLGGINVFDCLGMNKEKRGKKEEGGVTKAREKRGEGGEGREGGVR